MSIRNKVLEVAAKEAKVERIEGEELAFMSSNHKDLEKHKISLTFTFVDEHHNGPYAKDDIDHLDLDFLATFLSMYLDGFQTLSAIEAGEAFHVLPDLKTKADFYAEAIQVRNLIDDYFFNDKSFMALAVAAWAKKAGNELLDRFQHICTTAGILPPNLNKENETCHKLTP